MVCGDIGEDSVRNAKECSTVIVKPKHRQTWTIAAIHVTRMAVLGFSTLHAAFLTDGFTFRPITAGEHATYEGNNSTASIELGEPYHGGLRKRSVWGAWTAPGNGQVTISTAGSRFDTVLAVYTGSAVGQLSPVAQNDDVQSGFNWSSVSFPTKAGDTYSFAVDGRQDSSTEGQGTIAVEVGYVGSDQPGSEIGTDSFDARPALPSATRALGIANTRLASVELDEPNRVGGRNHTVWWRWAAPANGLVTLDTLASDFDTVLTVYAGSSLTDLSEVAINDNAPNVIQSRLTFQAQAGREYQIMVDGRQLFTPPYEGNVKLNLAFQQNFDPPALPGRDAFQNRESLEGPNARGSANNTFFGLDFDEPNHGSAVKRTVWWQWTAPADGPVDIRTEGSNFDTFLAVYTGSSLASLQLVGNNDDARNVQWSQVKFDAVRGVRYQIMVDGRQNVTTVGTGNIALSVNEASPAPAGLAIYPAVELEVPGVLGVTYQLQISADAVSWSNLGLPVPGVGQPFRVFDSTRPRVRSLYRYVTIP